MDNNKKVRILNDYRVIYLPEHHRAMKSDNWNGWVYEHIVVAEESNKRTVSSNEVVHHLDLNRSNNRRENLIILIRSDHARLHAWLDKGAPGWQQPGKNWMNSEKPKSVEHHCAICDKQLQRDQSMYCSKKCLNLTKRKVEWPTYDQIIEDLSKMNWEEVGSKYGVSSNSVRRWKRKYESDMAILSQAEGTPSEGAETSGEVKPS